MTFLRRYIQRLYLVRCFRENKLLFSLSILFIAAVLYGHKSSCEITPALVAGMYTTAEHRESDDLLMLMADTELLDLHHTIDEPRRMMIYSTLDAFYQAYPYQGAEQAKDPKEEAIRELVRKHPFIRTLSVGAVNPPEAYGSYLPWLMNYLRHAVDKKIHHLGIYQLHVHYNEENIPVADYRKVLYELDLPNTK
jgi:hypothetical protein